MWIILPKGYFHRCFIPGYPQSENVKKFFLSVDIVDNSGAQQFLADFYHISGPHSYQQITVYAIFQ